jgi:GTP-binding protein HflX
LFFERHEGGERAVLVHLEGQDERTREDPQEFVELVNSAGADITAFLTVNRHHPSPRFLIGAGKVEELQATVAEHEADGYLQSRPDAESGA